MTHLTKKVKKRIIIISVVLFLILLFLSFVLCIGRELNDSEAIDTMNGAKSRGVFLAEYKAYPGEFYYAGKRFVFYNIWSERAWDLRGPCRCKLVYENPSHTPYQFNMYLSESFYWNIIGNHKLIMHIPLDCDYKELGGQMAGVDSGQISRFYINSLPPDTIVVSLDTVISLKDAKYKSLFKVLIVKVK